MRNKYLKLIITFAVVMCVFCTSLTVFAVEDENNPDIEAGDNVFVPDENPPADDPVEEDNQGGLIDDTEAPETQATTKVTTTAPVIVTEGKDDNTTTTKKPSSTTTTKRNNSSSSNTTTTKRNNSNSSNTTTEADSTDTTEETLPEGQFYVHLVLGNGEKNKKLVMKEPGLVDAYPDPVWEGHIFEGWYSDAKFTKPWDFSKDKATKEMTIYAKWSVDAASMLYTITVSPVDGGKITVSPASATAGTPVIITVKPDDGKRLVEGSLTINGKSTEVLSFNMPAKDVVISAKFEVIPESVEDTEDKDNSMIFILIGAGVLVVGLIIAGVVILRRKNEIVVPEFDENGAVIIEDDEEVWVDESLVLEDAFPGVKPATDVVDDDEDDGFESVGLTLEAPVEKTKGLTDIVNSDVWEEYADNTADDNDIKLTEAVKEEKKEASDISKIDFSLFE